VNPTVVTGVALDLRHARHVAAGVAGWATKKDAVAALAALRVCGLNLDSDIAAHRARAHLAAFWVIGRPDHFNGITYLMTRAGAWVAGRLFDASPCWCETPCRDGHAAPWSSYGRDLAPATVTHTYTWSAGSVGVAGHDGKPLMTQGFYGPPVEVLAYLAQAWCVACTWKTTGGDGPEVQQRARWHRANPEQYPDHTTPRRVPALVPVSD
jgi:hypothetical protein